jgi:hypothetical protein
MLNARIAMQNWFTKIINRNRLISLNNTKVATI